MSDCREFILKVEVRKTRTINQTWIKKILESVGYKEDIAIYEHVYGQDQWMQFDIDDIEDIGDLNDIEREIVEAIKKRAPKATVKTRRYGYRCEWVEI